MKPNIIFYYEQIIKEVLLLKLNLNNIYNIPKISSLSFTMTFNNQMSLEDLNIVKTMLLLELITTQKACFKKIRPIFRNKKQLLIFSFEVKLRNYKMYNLLHLLVKDTIKKIFKHYILINNILTETNIYQFGFNDMNVFPFIHENFIKWPYTLNIQIFPTITIKHNYIYKFLFQSMKLPIK